MKILVVGGGGREHALAWKLRRDTPGARLFCAPGNAGTATLGENLPIAADDLDRLLDWAQREKPDLTVVGPEAPLCAGLADRFRDAGLTVFGPGAKAAQLEGSKRFAKEVMLAAGVPTAASEVFTDAAAAIARVRRGPGPYVVKADGLAAGKGVTICATALEAECAIDAALNRRAFGDAGRTVLVEEFLDGEEASILALVDGERVVPLASSQDHKRAFDGNRGPNTGGMGAYSPAPVVREDVWPIIRARILEPTLAELRRRGVEYRGVLYAGLMFTADGPKVLEFNCRFGDPETQALLPRWDGDLGAALMACAEGRLDSSSIRWRPEACVTVVMAAGGYPGAYRKGDEIRGLDEAARATGAIVFHAGTEMRDGKVVTAGGRVLNVTALGADIREARDRAYAAVARIRFADAHWRTDIADRALRPNLPWETKSL